MYQPVLIFIGLRYIYRKSTDCFSYFISWIYAIGITIGVTALIIVFSVMNGFEHKLQDNILKLIPQAILTFDNGSVNPQHLPNSITKLKGITHIEPLTICDVALQSNHNIATGIMLGISPIKEDPLSSHLINVKQTDLMPNKYNVILGNQLAWQLGVNRGDKLRIILPFTNYFTPIGHFPRQRLFNVIGTFIAKSEVDNYQLLVNIQDASNLMCYPPGRVTGWRLWLKEPLKIDKFSQQKMPNGIKLQDWRKRKGELFQAIHMEKNMIGLLLSLIIISSAFNIITSLSLAIIEKRNDIAILQTQGLMPYQIMIIFIIQGVSISCMGILLGTILGILLALKLNSLILMPIFNKLFSMTLPIYIDPMQIFYIFLTTIIIAILSAIFPSWYIINAQPARILRYE